MPRGCWGWEKEDFRREYKEEIFRLNINFKWVERELDLWIILNSWIRVV